MFQKKLNKILELHQKWLNNEEGGIRAYLKGAKLRNADLRNANLRDAYLSSADLRNADLRGANLRDVCLSGADLRSADLRTADLRDANLDFSCLPLSCKGLFFTIDEGLAKQLTYHIINLMQHSKLDTRKIFKKEVYKWLEDSHLVTQHDLPKLKEVI